MRMNTVFMIRPTPVAALCVLALGGVLAWSQSAPAAVPAAKAALPPAAARMAIANPPAPAPKAAAPAVPALPALTVAQIVAKHVAARGSVEAWKVVHGLQLQGKVEAGKGSTDPAASRIGQTGAHFPVKEGTVSTTPPTATAAGDQQVKLPIVMDFERPNKSRVEVQFDGKTAVQVFDGSKGWKYRPFLHRADVEPFSADELKAEAGRAEPEGLLVDYVAKGSKVTLDGTDLVDGAGAYRLKVTRKDGTSSHVWIDAHTFLDVKMDGTPRRMDGKLHDVYVVQRDFRQVDGVTIPFVLETSVDGYPDTHRLLLEKAVVNPKFDEGTFAKPKA